jgi:hypothetical protein
MEKRRYWNLEEEEEAPDYTRRINRSEEATDLSQDSTKLINNLWVKILHRRR